MEPPAPEASRVLRPNAVRSAIQFRFDKMNLPAPIRENAETEVARLKNGAYESFWADFMVQNKPVLLCGETDNWRSRREWVCSAVPKSPPGPADSDIGHDSEGRGASDFPKFERLAADFGEEEVCVAICGEQHFSDQRREELRMSEFLREWQALKRDSITAERAQKLEEEGRSESSLEVKRTVAQLEKAWARRMGEGGRLPYCKDWHFAHRFSDYAGYVLPVHFEEDWLNAYYDAHPELGDDYRRKLWIMFPPSQDPLLRDAQGEIIFVPSGWLHQVLNLDDCVSINHNWLNSCNIHHAVDQMLQDHSDVVRSISNCSDDPDFVLICERLLKAHAGMNLAGFHDLIVFCCRRELRDASQLLQLPWFTEQPVSESGGTGTASSASRMPVEDQEHFEMDSEERQGGALALVFRLLALRTALHTFEGEAHVRLLAERGCLADTQHQNGGGAMAELEQGIRELKRRWPRQWAPWPPQAEL